MVLWHYEVGVMHELLQATQSLHLGSVRLPQDVADLLPHLLLQETLADLEIGGIIVIISGISRHKGTQRK